MKASGILFLRMAPSVRTDAAGLRTGITLPLLERHPTNHRVTVTRLLGWWSGPEAVAFFDGHQAELRPGRPLQIELDRFEARENELHAHITRCELAPLAPSWHNKNAAEAAPHQEHAA